MTIRKFLIYKNRLFLINDQVYEPEQYSAFLEKNILLNEGEIALDIVTSCGFHAILLAEKAQKVVG